MKKIFLFGFLFFLFFGNIKAQWVSIHDYANNPVDGFADNGNILYAAIAGTGVYRSSNFGNNWILTNAGIKTQPFNNIAAKDSLVFVSSNYGLFRSTNYGITFDSLTSVYGTVYSVFIVDNYVYAGKVNEVYRSSDWGASWSNINYGIPVGRYSMTRAFAYSGNVLYVGIDTLGAISVYKSTNYGDNWIYCSDGITKLNNLYSLYSVDNLVFCGTAFGVYKSTNYGTNWSLIPGIPGNIGLFGFASSGSKNIFISAWNSGVYVSNDYGQSFILKNEGLESIQCTALHKFGNYLFLGTNPYSISCTIYRRPTSEVIGIKNISTEIPKEYKLYQNYPNPFNPTTVIRFQIKDSRHGGSSTIVKLIVYDILGKEIATLVNEKKQPGTYEVSFDGSNFASGVYFYRIQSGDFVQVKKMMLLK